MIKSYISNIDGAVTVEYSIMVALVSLGCIKSMHCIAVHCIAPTFDAISAFMG